MTITEEFYRELSDKVYWLDPKHSKYEPDLKINSEWDFAGVEFKILQIKDSLDGMQAMAAAPIIANWRKISKIKKFLQTFAYLNNEGVNTYIKRKEARSCHGK